MPHNNIFFVADKLNGKGYTTIGREINLQDQKGEKQISMLQQQPTIQ